MTAIWFRPITLEIVNREMKNGLVKTIGIDFIDLGSDYLAAQMAVDSHLLQFMGILHGGASCVLAETVGSVAAHYCVDSRISNCVGLDINVNHLRAVRTGIVIAIARPLHLGKTTQVWEIKLTDSKERLVAVSRLTVAVLRKKEAGFAECTNAQGKSGQSL